MPNAIVRSTLKTIWVRFNGDLNDETQRKKRDKKLKRKKTRLTKARKQLLTIRKDPTKGEEKLQLLQEIDELKEEIEELENQKDNAVVISLKYPRSGSSSIEAIRPINLPR